MVFQLVVDGSRQAHEGHSAQGASTGTSVFETFRGPDGEELPATSASAAVGSSDRPKDGPRVDELIVSGVRLFRTGAAGPNDLEGHRSSGCGAFEGNLPLQRTSVLLLVAVPVEVNLASLRRFFGGSLHEAVETLRVLRWDGLASELPAGHGAASAGGPLKGDFYSVVLLCRDQAAADSLYQEHHGRILTSELAVTAGRQESAGGPCCYLLFLEGVAYREALQDGSADTPAEVPNVAVELPMCPFCLERLDISVTGMITHNAGWLSSMEWDEPHSRCCSACVSINRACRAKVGDRDGLPPPACQQCNNVRDLWVCLVCGHMGCGRYLSGHAKDHALERSHHLCLDLSSGRIWHYAADVFVHRRLVQMAATSGRFDVVALPDPADEATRPAGRTAAAASSASAEHGGKDPDTLRESHLAMELDAVLASQLDYQRSLYEAKLRDFAEQQRRSLEDFRSRVEQQAAQKRGLEAEMLEAQQEQRRLERRASAAQQSKAKVAEELEFSKEMNRSLLANRAEMRRKSGGVGGPAGEAGVGEGASSTDSCPAPEGDALVLRLRKQVATLMEAVSR